MNPRSRNDAERDLDAVVHWDNQQGQDERCIKHQDGGQHVTREPVENLFVVTNDRVPLVLADEIRRMHHRRVRSSNGIGLFHKTRLCGTQVGMRSSVREDRTRWSRCKSLGG